MKNWNLSFKFGGFPFKTFWILMSAIMETPSTLLPCMLTVVLSPRTTSAIKPTTIKSELLVRAGRSRLGTRVALDVETEVSWTTHSKRNDRVGARINSPSVAYLPPNLRAQAKQHSCAARIPNISGYYPSGLAHPNEPLLSLYPLAIPAPSDQFLS